MVQLTMHVLEMLSEYRSKELSAIKLKEASDLRDQGKDFIEAMTSAMDMQKKEQWFTYMTHHLSR